MVQVTDWAELCCCAQTREDSFAFEGKSGDGTERRGRMWNKAIFPFSFVLGYKAKQEQSLLDFRPFASLKDIEIDQIHATRLQDARRRTRHSFDGSDSWLVG